MLSYNQVDFDQTMRSALGYSEGFVKGLDQYEAYFNAQLAEIITQAFYQYVDSVARLEPDRLHHVYEWGQAGIDSARLFRIESFTGRKSIRFVTEFQQSTSVSPTGTEPFVDKASIMEEGMTITVTPDEGDVLAFEGDDGEMVFTPNQVVIENPGGPGVKGQFYMVVREFFDFYLNKGIMKEFVLEMETPTEFTQGWHKGMNVSTGARSARRYLTLDGGIA